VARADKPACQGWTLLELMAVVAVIGVMLGLSLPSIQNTILAYRLSAAASSAAAAIQQTRFQAIKVGCKYTIAFTTGSNTYQVQTEDISGTPPVCAASFTNAGSAIPWTSAGSIRVTSSPTLLFDPGGIVYTQGSPPVMCTPCSVQVSNGSATKTVTISGVGNVKVTSP
jgi:prepilin-type N-terminal cleavage/methylation domain-containing protein